MKKVVKKKKNKPMFSSQEKIIGIICAAIIIGSVSVIAARAAMVFTKSPQTNLLVLDDRENNPFSID
jgi:hypothetical protein